MKGKKTGAFPNALFCIYQAVSDDMIFWAMFDVLFLTMNKGFTMVQVSLLFTISYWVAIALQVPSYYLSRKIKAEDMENAEWMPVIFLDDDGGIVWNYSSVEKFISHMEIIEKIYSFKLMN